MKKFSAFIKHLEQADRHSKRVQLLAEYFNTTSEQEKLIVLNLLLGNKPRRVIPVGTLKEWICEAAGVSEWLYEECYKVTGDVSETLAMLIPLTASENDTSPKEIIQFIESCKAKSDSEIKTELLYRMTGMDAYSRFVFLKWMCGNFRSPLKKNFLVKILTDVFSIPESIIAHKLQNFKLENRTSFSEWINEKDPETEIALPFPFIPIEKVNSVQSFNTPCSQWLAFYQFSGIRCQLIKRMGNYYLWNETNELLNKSYPGILRAAGFLPEGTVLDGFIIAPTLNDLVETTSGKNANVKNGQCGFLAIDFLEDNGRLQLNESLQERSKKLRQLLTGTESDTIKAAAAISFSSWQEADALRKNARSKNANGLLLRYSGDREKEVYFNWLPDKHFIMAVLIYIQYPALPGKNAVVEYTFAVKKDDALVPVARVKGGLDADTSVMVSTFARANAVEKFGPVRSIKPELVFKISFDEVQKSTRHKSGLTLVNPEIVSFEPSFQLQAISSLNELLQMVNDFKILK